MAKKQEPTTAPSEQAPRQAQTQPRFRMVPPGGPVTDIYADGVSSVMARGGVVKLDLYQAVGIQRNTNVEMRRSSHRLVMPATAIPELLRIFQNAMQAAQPQLRARPPGGPPPAAQSAAQSSAKSGVKSGAKAGARKPAAAKKK